MKIQGFLYQPGGVEKQPAYLHVVGDAFTLYLNNKAIFSGSNELLEIPSRIGNTSRKLQIEDLGLFETMDNDAIDEAFINGKKGTNFIHILESKWLIAIPTLLIGIFITAALYLWGIPYSAEKIAYAIPESVNEKISKGTFESIDKMMLSPSDLPESKKQLISAKFSELVDNYSNSDFNYRLHFRDMNGQPNAFALPDGNIVVTDALVEYADGEINEVLAVLLHEIGHVERRHGLRLGLEASSIGLLIAFLTGDAAASDDLLITLPVVLSTSSFSRTHESEADEFAFRYMKKAGIDPIHFARIMSKITRHRPSFANRADSDADDKEKDKKSSDQSRVERVFSYLSSHPVTEERVKNAEEESAVFNR